MENVFIMTSKAGNRIEAIDGFLCVDGKRVGCEVEPLHGLNLSKAMEVKPDAAYICNNIVLNATEGDAAKGAIETQKAEIAEKKHAERVEWEGPLVKHRVLLRSGYYLSDNEIATICILPDDDQQGYADWCKGYVFCTSAIDPAYKVSFSDSPTAQAIFGDRSRATKYTICSGESSVRIITEMEENAVLSECRAEEERREAAKLEKAEKLEKERISKEKKRAELMETVSRVDVSKSTYADEGGKQAMYTITVVFKDGDSLAFTDRNVFDFGRCTNPLYSIADGEEPGGLVTSDGGKLVFESFAEPGGWRAVRELTEKERVAYRLIRGYYGFAGSGIRM